MVWPGGGAGRCRLGNRSFRDFSNRLSAQRPTRDGGVAGTFLAQPAFEQRQVGEDERRACEPGTIGEEALDLVRAAAGARQAGKRSAEERRVGKEWVRPCRSRWSPYL